MAATRSDLFEQWMEVGIGGLHPELTDIFRRAFASRTFPAEQLRKMNIQHIRGLLLYGPHGCGKTLLARQISKVVSRVEPKIVHAPELMSKHSRHGIRNLFADAEKDHAANGDNADLHIILLDEVETICRQDGRDSVLNQLLAKMDGVVALNNVLVIGMTTRKDLVDPALLRPGRLEVQVEIGLPNRDGRLEILCIHTRAMAKSGHLGSDVNLEELADLTHNYSGAEIEALVRSATSFALSNMRDVSRADSVKVKREDFIKALAEIIPAHKDQQADNAGASVTSKPTTLKKKKRSHSSRGSSTKHHLPSHPVMGWYDVAPTILPWHVQHGFVTSSYLQAPFVPPPPPPPVHSWGLPVQYIKTSSSSRPLTRVQQPQQLPHTTTWYGSHGHSVHYLQPSYFGAQPPTVWYGGEYLI